MMAQLSPVARLQMCSRMFATARALAQAGLTAQGDFTDPSSLRRRLFLRFYGADFTEAQRRVILATLAPES